MSAPKRVRQCGFKSMNLISETEVDTVRVDHPWTIAEEASKLHHANVVSTSDGPPMVHEGSKRVVFRRHPSH